jgi:hypothetical protein
MELEDNFNQAVGEWIEYCRNSQVQISSFSESVRDCSAYKKIIVMGREALPLIRRLFDDDAIFYASGQKMQMGQDKAEKDLPLSMIKGHGLVLAVREIVGDDFSIPKEIRGRISAMEDYTKKWLDKNIHRYKPRLR